MANRLRRRWTLDFLRELVFAGDAQLAAEWVGVSHSHVWMRRLKEPKFAGLWDAAMRLNAELEAAAGASAKGPSTILRQGSGWSPSLRRHSIGPSGPMEPRGRLRPSLRDREERRDG